MEISELFIQKVRKSSEKSLEKFGKFRKLVFPNVRKFWKFRKFGNSENLEIPKFPKITKKWSSTPNSKIAKNSFRLKNRIKSSVKSSECRALICSSPSSKTLKRQQIEHLATPLTPLHSTPVGNHWCRPSSPIFISFWTNLANYFQPNTQQ
jgi:hypothetical protein